MYIINGQLERTGWFQPEKMGLNLEERRSTARVEMPEDGPEIPGNAWLLDETEPGAGIIWREKTSDDDYDRDTRTIQLEHIINTLRDDIIFGEIGPKEITGNNSATTCTAAQAVTKILSYQSLWTLGGIEYNVSNPYSFNGETLYDALETVTGSLEGAYWDYDLTTLPFKLYIRQLDEDTACEMRADRNLTKIRKTVDRSRMYTRFYPVGKNDLRLSPTPYVSQNENLYGRICKTETDQSKKTAAELTAWASEKLRNHSEPSVTVQGSGLDLSKATGESLDVIRINKLCRVPLPKYNTVITEKVTKLSWADKINKPDEFNFTLANLREDVASIINNQAKASGKRSRTAAKDAKEDHAWFVDTEEHVGMIAEAVAGEGADQDWSRVSQVLVDGEGIQQRVTKTIGDVVVAQASVEINESMINQIVSLNDNRPIKKYDKRSSFPATGSASYLYYSLANHKYYEWTNGAYSETTPGKELNRAGIISAINQDGSSTTSILGDKIYVGSVNKTLQALGTDAKNKIGVFADYMYVHSLSATDLTTILANIDEADIDNITLHDTMTADQIVVETELVTPSINDLLEINGIDIDNFLVGAEVSQDGKTLTLTSADGTETTFSKATSLSGAWSGNKLTVTASPQNVKYETYVGNDIGQFQGETGYFMYPNYWTPTATTPVAITDAKKQLTIADSSDDVVMLMKDGTSTGLVYYHGKYTAGVSAGKSEAGISTSWGTGSGANVLTVERALSSSTKSATFTVTAGNPTYSYNSSTHKYSLTGTAIVNNTQRASGVSSTGTEAYDAGVTQGHADSYKVTPDAGNNHANDWWNCIIYNSSGTALKSITTDQSKTGLYLPFADIEITANGRYLPGSYTTVAGHTAVVFTGITVNVPGGGSTPVASNIDLNSPEWMWDSAWTSLPSSDARRSAVELTTIKNLIRDNHGQGRAGWLLFRATYNGGTGAKWYRINTQWA